MMINYKSKKVAVWRWPDWLPAELTWNGHALWLVLARQCARGAVGTISLLRQVLVLGAVDAVEAALFPLEEGLCLSPFARLTAHWHRRVRFVHSKAHLAQVEVQQTVDVLAHLNPVEGVAVAAPVVYDAVARRSVAILRKVEFMLINGCVWTDKKMLVFCASAAAKKAQKW